jgi:6-phosphofructokinase
MTKHIGILTAGGDSPALNAAMCRKFQEKDKY